MSLRYILGRAGQGKTRLVMNEIKYYLDNGDDPLILLVPEQYTLQAERDLMEKLELPGIMQVEVLSFTRMASRIFNDVGGLTRTLLNEQGKNMILRRVINQNRHKLTIFKPAALQDGFVLKCSEIIAEMKQYNISPADLLDKMTAIETKSTLYMKLNDIAVIYEEMAKYLSGHYLDMEDYINFFIEKLEESSYFRESRIWMDNFTTISPQSLRVVEKLMQHCREFSISLTIAPPEDSKDKDLFTISTRCLRKIKEMAAVLGIKEEVIWVAHNDSQLRKSPEIIHLEKQLYVFPGRKYDEKPEHIHLFASSNMVMEVENLAAQIVALARDNELRWNQMAVICQDIGNYGPLIKRVFNEYDIPYFMDEKREIVDHPLIQFILASLDLIQRNYRYEDLARYCRTGFTFLDDGACDILENYLLRYGIKGSLLKEDFKAGDPANLDYLNYCRRLLMEPLLRLEENLASARDYASINKIIFNYLESMEIPVRLAGEIERMRDKKQYDLVNENTQIWNAVVESLQQISEILGEQEAALKEYRQVLEAGFISVELGIIPTTVDQVLVGSIQRSKSHDIKALFVLGLNDGVLPKKGREEKLLSDEEKMRLESLGLQIGLNHELRSLQEDYLIYNVFSKPCHELFLSYALADSEGRALRPSLLAERIKSLFPGLITITDLMDTREQQFKMISTPRSTFKYAVNRMRMALDGKPIYQFWDDVWDWYGINEEWQGYREHVLPAFTYHNQVDDMGMQVARKLYGSPLRSSVSRLEQYASCPFAHFISYGLSPGERKLYEVASPDIGLLFHNALMSYAQKIRSADMTWQGLDREDSDVLMDQVMEELAPELADGVFASTHRYRYLLKRLQRVGRRTAWILVQHIKAGDFQPVAVELGFGTGRALPALEIELPNGEMLYLEGRIDRVDIFDDAKESFVRIIDYKTGGKSFDLADAYNGLSLQLLLYLQAVLNAPQQIGRERLNPAGVFYFKIDDPLVKSDKDIMEEVEKQIAQKLKMDGVLLKDVRIIRAMDANADTGSHIIPAAITSNGEVHRQSSVLEESEFAALLQHMRELVKKMGLEIIQGRVRINPVRNEKGSACIYCNYKSICQFDPLFEDNRYRNLRSLKREEIINLLVRPVQEAEE
ncbi:helicase-exonuclease AddAB subunit AddB [Syntrophomonas palmitatica]|uniref:helicase-exonuclease AddAB subunit AddB n=1 Tax=Syntrophomonas palmitatica TaxID=402877 RepID=UPI0006D270DA|nr:helicase-exonuclease AddAB subunit AddB [Syntrophomonas palmitatica]